MARNNDSQSKGNFAPLPFPRRVILTQLSKIARGIKYRADSAGLPVTKTRFGGVSKADSQQILATTEPPELVAEKDRLLQLIVFLESKGITKEELFTAIGKHLSDSELWHSVAYASEITLKFRQPAEGPKQPSARLQAYLEQKIRVRDDIKRDIITRLEGEINALRAERRKVEADRNGRLDAMKEQDLETNARDVAATAIREDAQRRIRDIDKAILEKSETISQRTEELAQTQTVTPAPDPLGNHGGDSNSMTMTGMTL